MRRLLVLGSSGLVGSRFIDLSVEKDFSLSPKSQDLDITDKKSVKEFFVKNKGEFDTVVNFAAYTDVEGAEDQKGNKDGLSWQLNVVAVRNVAEVCRRFDKFLVQISTDFVFEGSKEDPGPYSEDHELPDEEASLGWYGKTKLTGERILQDYEETSIVRIAYPFRTHFKDKLDLARNILMLYDEERLYPMFDDQIISPTFIDEACRALEKIVKAREKRIYHVASSDTTTPFEFASYLIEKARGKKGMVKRGSLRAYLEGNGKTPKPIFGGLDSKKTQDALGMKFMTWRQAVDSFVKDLSF